MVEVTQSQGRVFRQLDRGPVGSIAIAEEELAADYQVKLPVSINITAQNRSCSRQGACRLQSAIGVPGEHGHAANAGECYIGTTIPVEICRCDSPKWVKVRTAQRVESVRKRAVALS